LRAIGERHQSVGLADGHSRRVGNLKSDKAIVAGARLGNESLVAASKDRCHDSDRRRTVVSRAARQAGNPGVAGSQSRAFGRQRAIGCAGANGNPVLSIAALVRQAECSGERCPCLKLDDVAAGRGIDRALYAASRRYQGDFTRRRGVGQGGINARLWQGSYRIGPAEVCQIASAAIGVIRSG